MKLNCHNFADGAPIPAEFAFAVIDPKQHFALSANRNPGLSWSDAPPGTKSFALICHDFDVPSRGDDVNQEGREIPESLPRVDFFHWLLWDIPAATRTIDAGSHSNSVTPHGKPGPLAPGGWQQGMNDFTQWFSGDDTMRGAYYGYDGPAPPWNDSLVHHYVFTLFALDTTTLEVGEERTGSALRWALHGHVMAEAAWTGTYTLNPRLAAAR